MNRNKFLVIFGIILCIFTGQLLTQGSNFVSTKIVSASSVNLAPSMMAGQPTRAEKNTDAQTKYCADHEFDKEIAVQQEQVNAFGSAKRTTNGWELTKSGKLNQAGAVWLKQMLDVEGGFATEFTLNFTKEYTCEQVKIVETRVKIVDIDDQNKTFRQMTSAEEQKCLKKCKTNGIYEYCCQKQEEEIVEYISTDERDSSRCGGEGIAFVLQRHRNDVVGQPGGGLGYSGILNAIAVEFDTFANPQTLDPVHKEEIHISVIANPGTATAQESFAKAWNDKPVNFKIAKMQNYQPDSRVRIEYLNQMLRVYINGILQISYQTPFKFSEWLGINSNSFFMGFTGSTGVLTQTQGISNWKIFMNKPSATNSIIRGSFWQDPYVIRASISTPTVVIVALKDKCSNKIPLRNNLESALQFKSNTQQCKIIPGSLIVVEDQRGDQTHQFSVECSEAGNFQSAITGSVYGQPITNPITVVTSSGMPKKLKLYFKNTLKNDNTTGYEPVNENPIQFQVLPLDEQNQVVEANVNDMKYLIDISWPNPLESESTYSIEKWSTGRFAYSIPTTKWGYFTISSSLFNQIQNRFLHQHSLPSGNNSLFWLTHDNVTFTPVQGIPTVKAGQQFALIANYLIKDDVWNNLNTEDYQYLENPVELRYSAVNQTSNQAVTCIAGNGNNGGNTNKNWPYQFQKQGNKFFHGIEFQQVGRNTLTALVAGKQMAQSHLVVNVIAGDWVWENTFLWPYDPRTGLFFISGRSELLQFQGSTFGLLQIFRDKYWNYVEAREQNKFKLELSGNFMEPMLLCSSRFRQWNMIGLRWDICDDQLIKYNKLVGRKNYVLSLKYQNLNNFWIERNTSLEIVSNKLDVDAGNGVFIPDFTLLYAHYFLAHNGFILYAGETRSFVIRLRTRELLRFNDFIDESQFSVTLDGQLLKNTERESFRIQRIPSTGGLYYLHFHSKNAGQKKLELLINLVSTKQSVVVNVLPNAPAKAWILQEFLQKDTLDKLPESSVEENVGFTFYAEDLYSNPTITPGYQIILQFQNTKTLVRQVGTAQLTKPGYYSQVFTTPLNGDYAIQSIFFTNPTVKQYFLTKTPGRPSITFTKADIDSKTVKNIVAGDVVTFYIEPKDKFYNNIPPSQFAKGNNPFSFKAIDVNKIPYTTEVSFTEKQIVYKFKVIRTDTLYLQPLLGQDNLRCLTCVGKVAPGEPNFQKSILQILDDGKWIPINLQSLLELDNINPGFNPVFYFILKDEYENVIENLGTVHQFVSELKQGSYTIKFRTGIFKSGLRIVVSEEDAILGKTHLELFRSLLSGKATFTLSGQNRAKNNEVQTLALNVMIRGDPESDGKYEIGQVSLENSDFTPTPVIAKAGEPITVRLNLRGEQGKLLKEKYSNPSQSINVLGEKGDDVQVTNGSVIGTYQISLTKTKEGKYDIPVQVTKIGETTFSTLKKPISVQVVPAAPKSALVTLDSFDQVNANGYTLKSGRTDSDLILKLIPKDSYNNTVKNLDWKELQLSVTHPSDIEGQPTCRWIGAPNEQQDQQIISIRCKKNGLIQVKTGLSFVKPNGDKIPLLQSEIKPSVPQANTSLGFANSTNITAGDVIEFRVYPKDAYGNPVKFDNKDLLNEGQFTLQLVNPTSPQGQQSVVQISGRKVDPKQEYAFWQFPFQQAGDLKVIPLFKGTPIYKNTSVLTVNPTTPNFNQILLEMFTPEINGYQPYNGTQFSVVKSNYPTFRVTIRDTYGNLIKDFPKGWPTTTLTVVQSNGEISKRIQPIILCNKSTEFFLCNNKNLQPELKVPKLRWKEIPGQNEYIIELKAGDRAINYNLKFLDSADNLDTSSTQVNASKTVITPSDIITTEVGVPKRFQIELRGDDDKRVLQTYENPEENIKVVVPGGQGTYEYTVTNGDKEGRYIVQIQSKKAYPSHQPLTAQVSIDGVQLEKPIKMTVTPGKLAKLEIINSETKQAMPKVLPKSNVDLEQQFVVKGYDAFGNEKPLETNEVPLDVSSNSGQTLPNRQVKLDDKTIRVQFKPVGAGLHKVKISNELYTIDLVHGLPYFKNTIGKVNKEQINAGELITFEIIPRDRQNNQIPVTPELQAKFQALFSVVDEKGQQKVKEELIEGPVISQGKDKIIYQINAKEAGKYIFSGTYEGDAILCQACTSTVQTTQPEFKFTKLQYMNAIDGVFRDFPETLIERNNDTRPIYKIQFADKFGNIITKPIEESTIKNMKLILYGNGNPLETTPIVFNLVSKGNYIIANLNEDAANGVKYGLLPQKDKPYTLKLNNGAENIQFNVILIGTGKEDITASTKPVDLKKTQISDQTIQTVAGQWNDISIELRADDNLRKKDASNNLVVVFEKEDPLNNNFTVIKGDKPGRFIVSVKTNKTYEASAPLKFKLKYEGQEIPAKLQLIAEPNTPKLIKVLTNVSKQEYSADEDVKYDVQVYDQYNNLHKKYTPTQIPMRIVAPAGVQDYTQKSIKDPNTFITTYTVTSRVPGQYFIRSEFLDGQSTLNNSFIIGHGAISEKYTSAYPLQSKVKAGDEITFVLYPRDKYNNTIPAKSAKLEQILVKATQESLPVSQIKMQPSTKYFGAIEGTLRVEKSGLVKLESSINNNPVECSNCSVTVTYQEPELKNTRFLLYAGENYKDTKAPEIDKASLVELKGKLYDKYNNPITAIDPNLQYTSVLEGNEMVPLNLAVTLNTDGTVQIAPSKLDEEAFKNLVPSETPYTLKLKKTLVNPEQPEQVVSIPLLIKGSQTGYGNGVLSVENTLIDDDYVILTAGVEYTFNLVLRTVQKKIFNQNLQLTDIVVSEAGTDKFLPIIKINQTDIKGKFTVTVQGTKTTKRNQHQSLSVTIKGIVAKKISFEIWPNIIDVTKTQIIEKCNSITTGQRCTIRFKLFDEYSNQYLFEDVTKNSTVNITEGTGNVSEVSIKPDGIFEFGVQAQYPPRQVGVNVLYSPKPNQPQLAFSENIKFPILQKLDPTRTKIQGQLLKGVRVNDPFWVYVVPKDVQDFTFNEEVKLRATLSGPYSNQNLGTALVKPNVKFVKLEATGKLVKVDNQGSNPDKEDYYYNVTFDHKQIVNTGFYSIYVDFLETPEDGKRTVKGVSREIRVTQMDPTDTKLGNSVLSIVGREFINNELYEIEAGVIVKFKLATRDEFKNQIYENRHESLDMFIEGLDKNKKEYTYTIENQNDGSYIYSVNITKLSKKGEDYSSKLKFTLKGEVVTYAELQKVNSPSKLVVVPGPCSKFYPDINTQNVTEKKVIVGYKTRVQVRCRDIFNNPISVGGSNFSAIINGKSVVVVQRDNNIPNQVYDFGNGSYYFEFIVGWEGSYTMDIFLNSEAYGNLIEFGATFKECPIEKSFQCPNTKECVASPYDCNLPEYQISCDGYICKTDNKCVKNSTQCPCPEDYKNCSSGVCLPSTNTLHFCPTKFTRERTLEFPVLCPDGTLRKSLNECPTRRVCPIGFKLCADLSCFENDNRCPEFQKCPPQDQPDKFVKCEDQSCVSRPEDCATRVTCPHPDMLLCPDKTCVFKEVQCRQPPRCDQGFVRCPDFSCQKSLQDCNRGQACPLGLALCSDGTCKEQCSTIQKSIAQTRILQRVVESESNSQEIICPGGERALSYFHCGNVETCPPGLSKCPDGTCAINSIECQAGECPKGLSKCWDGSCAANQTACPPKTSCPVEQPVKCADGKCASSLAKCAQTVTCPPYAPFKCASGECRISDKECPSQKTCPPDMPILCPDGSCKTGRYHCDNTQPNCGNLKVCSDGSCSTSLNLCPTQATCAVGYVKCWDGKCALSHSACANITEDEKNMGSAVQKLITCPDGISKRTNFDFCPTLMICPIEAPIRCDDNSCKQSKSECLHSECNEQQKRCPDGSCVQINQRCGTPVTCSSQQLYKCYDNTCRKDPKDCPPIKKCPPVSPFLCADGACVSHRILCRPLDQCPDQKPVRCPDFLCYKSSAECKAIEGCPKGFVKCEDGSCMYDLSYCEVKQCPIHLPVKCYDGLCVKDQKYCSNKLNGCPYNKPKKCADGSCIAQDQQCQAINVTTVCDQGQTLCPDGACVKSRSQCMNIYGCPEQDQIMCAQGICVKNTTECPVATCPKETPIRCENGFCVKTRDACPSFLDDSLQCKANKKEIVPCADGLCAESSDLCKPIFKCPSNQVRCGDGSCRYLESLCPINGTMCPRHKPFRCQVGICAASEEDCPTENGCPFTKERVEMYKCPNNGKCVESESQCKLNDQVCPLETPFKCPLGGCARNAEECYQCTNDKPILCYKEGTTQKECVSDISECRKNFQCDQNGEVRCPDMTCAKTFAECKTLTGCPLAKPYRCSDGSCKKLPFDFKGQDGCKPIVVCPQYRPHLCADGSCKGDPETCAAVAPCKEYNKIRNGAGKCVSLDEAAAEKLCPVTSPILCSNGFCVENPLECIGVTSLQCSKEKPIECVSGICVRHTWECLPKELQLGYDNLKHERLLREGLSNEEALTRLLGEEDKTVDSGCSKQFPKLCVDGSCKRGFEECGNIKACSDPNKPYRCKSGLCVNNKFLCPSIKQQECPTGKSRCADGTCRYQCPPFDGCNIEEYQCPNGKCAKTISECASDSNCPHNKPFRCINNLCVASFAQCQSPLRNYQVDNFFITVSPTTSQTFAFVKDDSSPRRYAKIIIPASALLDTIPVNSKDKRLLESQTTENDNRNLKVWDAPDSLVRNKPLILDSKSIKTQKYIEAYFPLSYEQLEYHHFVRSPVIVINDTEKDDSANYRFPLFLQLKVDLVQGATNITQDYCLARANEDGWRCVSRPSNESKLDEHIYPFQKDGIYTVVFNPVYADVEGSEGGDWFSRNFVSLLKWTGIVAFIIAFISYWVWRLLRYKGKYRKAKQEIYNMQEQLKELQAQNEDYDKYAGVDLLYNPNTGNSASQEYKKRIQQLNGQKEKYQKRLEHLENTSQDITEQGRSLKSEIETLRREYARLKQLAEDEQVNLSQNTNFGREFE